MGGNFLLVAGHRYKGVKEVLKFSWTSFLRIIVIIASYVCSITSPELDKSAGQSTTSLKVGPFHGPFCCTRSIKKKEKSQLRMVEWPLLDIWVCWVTAQTVDHGVSRMSWNSKPSNDRVFHSWAWNRMMSSDNMLKPRSYSTKPGLSVAWCPCTLTNLCRSRQVHHTNGNLWCSECQA